MYGSPSLRGSSRLQREQEEARNQLNQLLKETRPKNFAEGFCRGVSDVIAGCIGAVGIAILAPTAGLALGVESGGLVGGVCGLACGTCLGVTGAFLIVTQGLCDGVLMLCRGCFAIPASITQPRKGKWWNESDGEWVETNLEREAVKLEEIPDDDEDILGNARNDENATSNNSHRGNVADTQYYDTLECDTTSDKATIKKHYYKLARKYHPDKNPGNEEAAEKFKKISDAYQVLSDPELRKKYDSNGIDGVQQDSRSDLQIDPSMLFAFLFGSDMFSPYIGILSTATSFSIGDNPKINISKARELQKRRCTRLAIQLATRLDSYISGSQDIVLQSWEEEASRLANASYGYQLLKVIGQVYSLCSVQFLGSLDSGIGLPSVSNWAQSHAAEWKRSTDNNKQQRNTVFAGLTMIQMHLKFEQAKARATTHDEVMKIEFDYQKEMATSLLNILWTTTVIDITSTLHETCQMVLFDTSVSSDFRKQRANALDILGGTFHSVPVDENVQKKDIQQLYEEAAFAAMLETIKRKDEAAFKASMKK